MPITPTYPGVYVEEVPSGVRTITGVSTSIAAFIGRAKMGPLDTPVLCLNYSDFERVFSSQYAGSDLARAVRLFFQNGGSQCYVMRIADGATYSEVTLKAEDGNTNALRVKAKSAGVVGDTIRLVVTYNRQDPESTFNLEIFRWAKNSAGARVKADREEWTALSMDRESPRYAKEFVNQNSKLVELDDKDETGSDFFDHSAVGSGHSQSGRGVSNTPADFWATWRELIQGVSKAFEGLNWSGSYNIVDIKTSGIYAGTTQKTFTFTVNDTGEIPIPAGGNAISINWDDGSGISNNMEIPVPYAADTPLPFADDLYVAFGAGTITTGDTFTVEATPLRNSFRISVDGNPPVEVKLLGLDFDSAGDLDSGSNGAIAHLHGVIQNVINNELSGLPGSPQVTGTLKKITPNPTINMLRIESANGDVRIEPASSNDLAVPMMLGTAQGGIEVSRYAKYRPAPTGIVFNLDADLDNLMEFAELLQDSFDTISIDSVPVPLDGKLQTVDPAIISSPKMYQDGYPSSDTGNCEGVREKWGIIADAINEKKASDPTFKWSADVWGSRLALIPEDGGDSTQRNIETSLKAGGGTDIGPGDENYFTTNVRYYSLGVSGTFTFQAGGVKGSDGNAPTLTNYRDAFKILDKEVDLFNLMILPYDEGNDIKNIWGPASVFCQKRRAFLLMDAPVSWDTVQTAASLSTGVNKLRVGLVKDHSAIFYPRVTIQENGLKKDIGASGAIAGLMARIDSSRGVWKAPAGTEADLRGVVGLEHRFSDDENGVLNPRAINTLRVFPTGIVNWGARTMDGDDDFQSEYKYIPVRRLALYIEESLYRGLKWVVFEPNDEPLWAQIRLNVGSFMQNLFRQGAFQGQTPKDAYFVKCDGETTIQEDINLGIVNILVGFAPMKPAEFVVIKISQKAGQAAE